ncbi:DUF5658 family protein [Natronomonas salina]|uniref:DUF5658 family protein n=1 Tax=Natronomonas salina TaxID=1710540 RepID=UPI001BA9BE23|nr:DUF5658 family protein [Natronomonas salina]
MLGDSGTDLISDGDHLEALATRQRRVWLAAILLYGVGDTVTTFWGLSTGGIAEAGPVAAPLMEAHGRFVLLGVKVVTFGAFYLLWRLVRTPGRVAVPLALATVGALVTAWNLVVISSA